MNSLSLMLRMRMRIAVAGLTDSSRETFIRNISTSVVLGILLYSGYLFFHSFLFRYVVELEMIGFLLIERLISVGFLIFFAMLIISSFIYTLTTVFKSRETEYLMSTPLEETAFFAGRYFDILIYSSWAIVLAALPILLAYARIRGFAIHEYVSAGLLVLLPFVIIACSLGALIAMLTVNVSIKIGKTKFIFISCCLFILVLIFLQRLTGASQLVVPFTDDFRALNIFINNFSLNSHPLTPNFWLIQGLRSLVHNRFYEFFMYTLALISTAFFFLVLVFKIAERTIYSTIAGVSSVSSSESKTSIIERGFFSFLNRFLNTQTIALLKKDILLFMREPSQWAQLLLLMALLALYFFNLRLVPLDIEIEQWRTIITVINFGFCGFFLATLAVKFIYPLISLEGDSLWVVKSSPVSGRVLFRQKFWTSVIFFLLITETIGVISGSILHLESIYKILTIGGIFMMSFALSSIAVGFGAAYPDFSEKNPNRIASSPGGVVTVVVSLVYVIAMTAILTYSSTKFTDHIVGGSEFPIFPLVFSITAAIVLNLFAVIVPIRIGLKAFEQRN